MHRRDFVCSALGATLMAAAGRGGAEAAGQTGSKPSPEFYEWRHYLLRGGTQGRRLAEFLQAAIPALNRLGHSPIGVFEVVAGLPSPSVFVLTPSSSLDHMLAIEAGLQSDPAFLKAAEPYMAATAADPVYLRQELTLLSAFPNVPRIEVPAATAAKKPRLFELRTYESHNGRAHRLKMQMFTELGETEIFRRCGLTPVFFGRTLVGSRMPNFTYMLVHDNMPARDKSWDNFRTDPDWKKLAATSGYADADIVSNITTVFLRPAAYSQI
jgi:hypothetical protein